MRTILLHDLFRNSLCLKKLAILADKWSFGRGLVCAALFFTSCQAQETRRLPVDNPTVTICTAKGDIQVELFADKAPITVKNFLQYVDEKAYDQTIFHRVIDGFMIQGGGFIADMSQKPSNDTIRNEADNRVPNKRGTLAMARTSDIHSASNQFFINVNDNDGLNYRNPTPGGFGYCVFGKVTAGMDVVDQIKKVKTATKDGHENVPVDPVTILEVKKG